MVQNTLALERLALESRRSLSAALSVQITAHARYFVHETDGTEILNRVRCTAVGHSALTLT